MTTDGISTEDWDQVRGLACQIVNTSSQGNEEASSKYTERLLLLLDNLQAKYGELPSLLATRADYIEDLSERLRLLKKAYELAERRQDRSNQGLIASSIAQIYIEELANLENSGVWLDALEKSLDGSSSQGDVEEFNKLKKKVERLKALPQTS